MNSGLWQATRGRHVGKSGYISALTCAIPGTDIILPALDIMTRTGPDCCDFQSTIWAWSAKGRKVAERIARQLAEHDRAFACERDVRDVIIHPSRNHRLHIIGADAWRTA